MTHRPITRTIMRLVIVLLALSACQQTAPESPATDTAAPEQGTDQPDQTDQPEAVATEEPTMMIVTYGPGSFDLTDPAQGLSDLSSYRATLTLSFDGTTNGQPDQWTRTWVMLASDNPSARQVTDESAGADPEQLYFAELNGALYQRQNDGACIANPMEDETFLAVQWEPARYLSGIMGADAAGSETINSVPADHYTFDERALGQSISTTSTGDVWIASDGGYIVRYLLATEAGADYFGEGIEGTLTLSYDLTEINSPIAIDLPADCPLGMIDAPLLPDAGDVVNTPGRISYTTPTTVADAAAFYQEQLPESGWEPGDNQTVDETKAYLNFTQGEQQLLVIITLANGVTAVRIALNRTSAP